MPSGVLSRATVCLFTEHRLVAQGKDITLKMMKMKKARRFPLFGARRVCLLIDDPQPSVSLERVSGGFTLLDRALHHEGRVTSVRERLDDLKVPVLVPNLNLYAIAHACNDLNGQYDITQNIEQCASMSIQIQRDM